MSSGAPLEPQSSLSGKERSLPLRLVLTLPFLLQIALVIGLVSYLSLRNGQRSIAQVVQQIQRETSYSASHRIQQYLSTAERVNRFNAEAIASQSIDPQNYEVLTQLFWSQRFLFALEPPGGIYFGTEQGELQGVVLKTQPYPRWELTRAGALTQGRYWVYRATPEGLPGERVEDFRLYDPRQRPWYQQAIAQGGPIWTDLYVDFTELKLAITAAEPVYNAQNQLQGVVGTDIVLDRLQTILQSVTSSPAAVSYVIDASGLLIASSTGPAPLKVLSRINPTDPEPEIQRLAAVNHPNPLIRSSGQILSQEGGQARGLVTSGLGERSLTYKSPNGRAFLNVTPLRAKSQIDWQLVTVIPERDFAAQIRASQHQTLGISALALLLTLALGGWLNRSLAKPILGLRDAAQAATQQTWSLALSLPPSFFQEMTDLGYAFRVMTLRLQEAFARLEDRVAERKQQLSEKIDTLQTLQSQLIEMEKMAALGELVGGIAQAMGRPLQAAEAIAQDIDQQLQTLQTQTFLSQTSPTLALQAIAQTLPPLLAANRLLQQELEQTGDLVTSFKQVAVDQSSETCRPFRLIPYLKQVEDSVMPRFQAMGLRYRLQSSVGEDLVLHSYPGAIAQVLTQLIENALWHGYGISPFPHSPLPISAEAGPVLESPTLDLEIWTDCDRVILCLSDRGQGIAPEHLDQIFKPFFTTGRDLGFKGLGLAVVSNLVIQTLQGTIDCRSKLGEGTSFVLNLPRDLP